MDKSSLILCFNHFGFFWFKIFLCLFTWFKHISLNFQTPLRPTNPSESSPYIYLTWDNKPRLPLSFFLIYSENKRNPSLIHCQLDSELVLDFSPLVFIFYHTYTNPKTNTHKHTGSNNVSWKLLIWCFVYVLSGGATHSLRPG